MSEQRKFKRYFVNARVRLQHDSLGETEAMTLNISNGGALVVTPLDFTIEQGTELVMQFLDSQQSDVIFNMRVIHSDSRGIGLEFCNFEVDDKVYVMSKLANFWQP